MKLVFDLTTPKTTLLFHRLGDALRKRGHEVLYVSREYRESNALQKMLRMEVEILGRHGGAERASKAFASAGRQAELLRFLLRESPDVVVCLSSVEASRAAYGLGIPIACFNDLPEAEHTARLTIPLATVVLAPHLIPAVAYERLAAKRVFRYRSLDPLAWLDGRDREPSSGAGQHGRTVVFREEESEAAYLAGLASMLPDAVNALAERHPDWRFVGVPRYSPDRLRERLRGANVVVLAEVVDSAALLAGADLFLGGGGTMNIEAAYFGTPTICCRPIACAYETWLIEQGLAFRPRELTVAAVTGMAEELVGRRVDAANLRDMRFPTGELLDEIEAVAGAGQSRPARRAGIAGELND